MTTLSFDEEGVDVVYEGTEFRVPAELIEKATDEPYDEVTDHEVLKIIDPDPSLNGEPRRVCDILR